jgi:hypothetical protein
LVGITRPEHIQPLKEGYSPDVAVHVRLGDFQTATAAAAGHGKPVTNTRIPLDWYADVIRGLRLHLGTLRVEIFSDGTDKELEQLTSLPNVSRKTFGSSLADILALSTSSILVASGSTFSMWASFLGRQPVVWHPGRRLQPLLYERPAAEVESIGQFERAFVEECRLSLRKRPV